MTFRSICLLAHFLIAIVLIGTVAVESGAADRLNLSLSAEEQEWIQEHPVVRIGIDASYAPYSFQKSDGQYEGIAPEFIQKIEQSTGLKFEVTPDLSWPEILDSAKNKSIDVIATAFQNSERDEYLGFSQIYINTPLILMTQVDNRKIRHPADIIGKRIALVEGYSSTLRVLQDYPDIIPYYVKTPLEGLQALAIGEVDAYIGVLGVSTYVAKEYGLTNLAVAARYDLRPNGQRFAVRKDWQILVNIIDKALDHIQLREKNDIIGNWVPILDELLETSSQAPSFLLTKEEEDWLRNHREIKVGMMNAWPPMNYVDSEGIPRGIGVDFIELFNKRLKGALRLVPDSWSNNLAKLDDHEIEAVMDITPTAERQERYNFTTPYLGVPHVIFARKGTAFLNDISDLEGKIVALEDEFYLTEKLRRSHPLIKIRTFPSTSDALDAVVKKQADAYIGNRAVAMYIIRNELIDNLIEHGKLEDSTSVNSIAVRKDMPVLQGILQKTLDSMSVAEQRAITKDWVDDPQRLLRLTREEREWLKTHPVIKVAADIQFPPIEFVDANGQYNGLAIDYLKEISDRLGVTFELDPKAEWATNVEKVKFKQLDMFSAAAATVKRREFATFTEPYMQLPLVIFTREDVPYVDGIAGLQEKKVAVVKGYAVADNLKAGNFDLNLVEVSNVADGLQQLHKRKVDAYIGSILVTSQTLREQGLADIKVAGQTPFSLGIAMGVRDDWPVFKSVLQKTLNVISEEKRREIINKWVGLRVDVEADYTLFWQFSVGGVVLLMMFLGWNTYLQRQMDLQTVELRSTNARLHQQVEDRTKAEAEAKAANKAKSTFLTNMSHEFRTPLNAILGYTEFMLMRLKADEQNKKNVEYLENVQVAGKHMLELVDDLMDLSVIDLGEMLLDEDVTNTSSLITDVQLLMEGKIKTTKKVFHWSPSKNLPNVIVDARRSKQVLINLVENAIKFTHDGGVITISDYQDEDGNFCLCVEDSGIGIPKEEREEILKVFSRGNDPFIRTSEGAGLGLAICVRIAQLHGGELKLESNVGIGTKAIFMIPSNRVAVPKVSSANSKSEDEVGRAS